MYYIFSHCEYLYPARCFEVQPNHQSGNYSAGLFSIKEVELGDIKPIYALNIHYIHIVQQESLSQLA
jgi:hypothetical protein